MVGQFRVTVTEAIAENRIVGYDELATASTLPEKFADANATTLSAAVTADGKNEFDFALEPTDD